MPPNVNIITIRDRPLLFPEGHHRILSESTNDIGIAAVLDQSTPIDLEQLPDLLKSSTWDSAISLIYHFREDIPNHKIKIVCQGETCFVTPMHYAVGCILQCPTAVLEALVDVHPSALLMSGSRRGLSPVHLGLIKGTIGVTQAKYLLSVCPELALHTDVDGNLPLHLAAEYASNDMIQCILEACPSAAGCQTKRQRYPLHLLTTARCQIVDNSYDPFDLDATDTSIATMKSIIDAYPYALQQPDLQGRLPLHSAACTPYPRWDVLQLLCDSYPAAILVQDEHHKIPLQLLKRFASSSSLSTSTLDSSSTNQDNDVVLTFLHDRTNAEKRKNNSFHKLLSKVVPFRKKNTASSPSVDWMYCYG